MRWVRELKPYAWLAAIVALYLVLREVFSRVAGDHGLLTPSGSVETRVVVLGLATLALRFVVLVVVPMVAVYRLVWRLVGAWRERPS